MTTTPKHQNRWRFGLLLAILGLLGIVSLRFETRMPENESEPEDFSDLQVSPALPNQGQAPLSGAPASAPSVKQVWADQAFSLEAESLVKSLSSGRLVKLQIGELPEVQYRFRPVRMTTEDFGFTDGVDNPIPMDYAVFQGRAMSVNGGEIQRVSAAVV